MTNRSNTISDSLSDCIETPSMVTNGVKCLLVC